MSEPKRGDIVAFYYPDDEETVYLKRIIGLPGETVEGRDGKVYVDGEPLEEDYVKEEIDSDFGPFCTGRYVFYDGGQSERLLGFQVLGA